jgi:hypothetical protein
MIARWPAKVNAGTENGEKMEKMVSVQIINMN